MKIRLKIVGILITMSGPLMGSNTFFSTTPSFQAGFPERETMLRDALLFHEGRQGACELSVYSSGLLDSSKKLARYFLPFHRCELLVAEDGAISADERDVNAMHLNINHLDPNNTFQSTVAFHFHRNVIGLGCAARFRMFSDPSDDESWWCGLSAPVEAVRHCVSIEETVMNAGGRLEDTRVATVTDAFAQDSWQFGRIDGKHHEAVGLADVEFQFGYGWGAADEGHAELYGGVLIPTGNRPTGVRVFEPIFGNNGHWAALWGGLITRDLYAAGRTSFSIALSAHGRFLFRNTQVRSFDAKGKPWSRYMEVYTDKGAAQLADTALTALTGDRGTPGINVFTKPMEVQPGIAHTVNAALLYREHKFHGEVGYYFHARQAENVCLKEWTEAPAFVSFLQDGNTSKSRTINRNASGSDDRSLAQYQPLTIDDLDLQTAAHPASIQHGMYLSFGYRAGDQPEDVPWLSVGGSYDFLSDSAALDGWHVWIKMGTVY